VQKCAGFRTVPIEVGDTYLSPDWTQKLITLSEFIDSYVANPDNPSVGYLAQTQLFEQIPELRKGYNTRLHQ
jgi:lysine-specific demethylase 8